MTDTVKLDSLKSHLTSIGPEVSFERPELSACLEKLDKRGPQYQEALGIIRSGKEMLARRPRADMPGFQPCEVDQRRETKYQERRQIELQVREALRKGEKVYDKPHPPLSTCK